MNQIEQKLTEFWEEEFPDKWSFLWSPKEAQRISNEHKDQIHFINEEGTAFLKNIYKSLRIQFSYESNPFDKNGWQPFNRDYYSTIERFEGNWNKEKEVKKWLYNRSIPFSKYVLITADRSNKPVMLTWKMVIKYWEGIFWEHDLTIGDTSFEWCLFYQHDSKLILGKDVKFDREKQGNRTMEMNRIIQEWQNQIEEKKKTTANRVATDKSKI